jgi:hypothetical protein
MEIRDSAWSQQYYRKALVLSVLFGLWVPVCAGVGELLLGRSGVASVPGTLFIAAAVISLSLLPGIERVRRRMLGGGPGLHAVVDQVMVPQNRYRRMLQAVAASLGLSLLPAIMGVGLVLLGAGRSELYLGVGWSVVLFAVYVPRYGQWNGWFAQRSTFR